MQRELTLGDALVPQGQAIFQKTTTEDCFWDAQIGASQSLYRCLHSAKITSSLGEGTAGTNAVMCYLGTGRLFHREVVTDFG